MKSYKELYLKRVNEVVELGIENKNLKKFIWDLLNQVKDLRDLSQPRALSDNDKKRILSDFYEE